MPPWTISAPIAFKKSVQETAKKLGLSYGAYLRTIHYAYLKTLSSKDFEKAKLLNEMQESKERLSALREKETILLREKGYKNKNLKRILSAVDDPELKKEIIRISELREQEADNQLRLLEEIDSTLESNGNDDLISEQLSDYEQKLIQQCDDEVERQQLELNQERNKMQKKAQKNKELTLKLKLFKNPKFSLTKGDIEYLEEHATKNGITFLDAKKELFGDIWFIRPKHQSNDFLSFPLPSKRVRNKFNSRNRR